MYAKSIKKCSQEEYDKQIRYSAQEIDARLTELGRTIDRDHPNGVVLLVYLRAAALFGATGREAGSIRHPGSP